MEKITIIIPVYNAEKYLKKCIESVVNQTYKNLEILIIIDGATDTSLSIVEEYAKNDVRIKIINRENKGIFYTRMEGIKKATSNYIYFVDADDWIEENTIEIMYQYKEKYHANIVRSKNYYKDEKEKITIDNKIQALKKEDFDDKIYISLFGSYDFASIWNQLIEKKYFEKLENIDYSINFGEDYLLNLNIYKNIDCLVLVPDYLYHYRTNNNSITNQQSYEGLLKKLNSCYKSHREIVEIIDEYQEIQDKQKYKKIATFRMIRGLKNRMIEFASFGIQNNKEREVYKEIEKIVGQEEYKKLCQMITKEELLELSKQENHKFVIKNIYEGKIDKIINYIKRIYILGKKIKKIMRR